MMALRTSGSDKGLTNKELIWWGLVCVILGTLAILNIENETRLKLIIGTPITLVFSIVCLTLGVIRSIKSGRMVGMEKRCFLCNANLDAGAKQYSQTQAIEAWETGLSICDDKRS